MAFLAELRARAGAVWADRSLRQAYALAAFGVLLVVAICVLSLMQVDGQRRAAIAGAHQSALNLSEILAEHTARTFEALERTLHEAAAIREETQRGRFSRDAGRAALEHLQKSSPAIIALGWSDTTGQLQTHTYPTAAPRPNIATLPHFRVQVHAEPDHFYISAPFRSVVTGRWISAISLRLSGDDGSFAGVVTAAIDKDYFTSIHRLLKLGERGTVSLTHMDGLMFTRVPAAPEFEGKSFSNTDFFQSRIVQALAGAYESVSQIDGRDRIFGYKVVPGLPLVMGVSFDKEEVLEPVYQQVRTFAPIVLLLVALVIFGVLYLTRQAHVIASKTRLLSATLDSMDQGLLMIDARGKVPLINRRATELLDLPEHLTRRVSTAEEFFVHFRAHGEFDDIDDDMRAKITAPLSMTEPYSYERTRRTGAVLEVRNARMPQGGIVRTYTDVTARKRDEERFRGLLEASPEATIITDVTGRIVLINGRCEQLFGITRGDLVDQWVNEILPEGSNILAHRPSLLQGGHKKSFAFDPDGTRFPIEVSVSGLQTVDQILLSWSVRDISAREAAEQALREAKERAEAATRAKDDFLANVSHELRTPLTAIIGSAELLLKSDPPLAERRRYLDIQLRAGTGLLSLINDILDFSKIEAGQLSIAPAPTALRGKVENCLALLADQAAAKNLALSCEVDDSLPETVLADPGRLQQVLLNLLSNAIKFTDHGAIKLVVSAAGPEPVVGFAVTDTGQGIPADKLPLLFQRFVQVDASASRRQSGTGLGLAISKRLVALMGGDLAVASEPGVGSTFAFAIPLPAITDSAEAQAAFVAETSECHDVLLVDDNDLSRQIVAAMLQSAGHRVTQASSGADAVARTAQERFDIVLMDLQMPGMDGYEAARTIRRQGGRRVPIVALTANVLAEDAARVHEAGMDAHIAKPVDWPRLFALMTQLAGGAGTKESPARLDRSRKSEPVFDAAKRNMLREAIGREKAESLSGMFLADVKQRLAAWEQIPPAEIAERAHSLVGGAGMLGFLELAAACRSVEEAARGGLPLDQLAAECNAACRRALAVLEREQDAAA